MHRDREEDAAHRPDAAHLTDLGARFGHPVDHLDEVTVRALVLVERHGGARLAPQVVRQALRVASPASMKRLLLTVALAALAAPGAAVAHAILLQTSPANRAVLARSPGEIRVTFDDAIRLGAGNAAVANADGASILAGPPSVAGHSLILRLRARAAAG